eukprot:4908813-Prymnesium_polylepis.2
MDTLAKVERLRPDLSRDVDLGRLLRLSQIRQHAVEYANCNHLAGEQLILPRDLPALLKESDALL